MERFADRVAAARKYLPDFGVASYCGMAGSLLMNYRVCSTITYMRSS
jgi:hypothetical protein